MLVILTNTSDSTADYVVSRLASKGFPFLRLDTDTMLQDMRLTYVPGQPFMEIDGERLHPLQVSTLWYRRPQRLLHKHIADSPEGDCAIDEWSEALEGFFAHVPMQRWINLPSSNALASRKLEQLTRAKAMGLSIPDTLVTQSQEELRQFYSLHQGKIIVKPLGRAYIERPDDARDSLIFTNRVRPTDLDDLSDLERCPTLFQQAINKRSDVRITVVDTHVHAIELLARDSDGGQRCDIRRNNMSDVSYQSIALPAVIDERIRSLVASYHLRFAAIDMAVAEDGQWFFFEINPNGQWAWLDLCGVADIGASLITTFINDSGLLEE